MMKSDEGRVLGSLFAQTISDVCALPGDADNVIPLQPVEAAPVPHPNLPGVDYVILIFRDGRQYTCGITQDKGCHETPEGLAIKYSKLSDGTYGYQTTDGKSMVSVRIDGDNVYGRNDQGKAGKLTWRQGQIYTDSLKTERATCAKLIETILEELEPVTGPLEPCKVINLGEDALIQKIYIVGTPPVKPH